MAFCSAKYNEATFRERKSSVRRIALRDMAAFIGEWDRWCDVQPMSADPSKIHLMETLATQAERLASWKRLRDNVVKKDNRDTNRTPIRKTKRD